MNRKLFILLILFATIILVLLFSYTQFYKKRALIDVDYLQEVSSIKKVINSNNKINPKYYYYNIWDLKCKPCVQEMPLLDSIANTLPSSIKFVFVCGNKNEKVLAFLNKKKLIIKKFTFINEMDRFIAAVYKKANNTYKAYPTHVIMDSLDNIIFFSQGSLNELNLNSLRLSVKEKKRFAEKLKDPLIKKLESLK